MGIMKAWPAFTGAQCAMDRPSDEGAIFSIEITARYIASQAKRAAAERTAGVRPPAATPPCGAGNVIRV
jgi:hypothetical protein